MKTMLKAITFDFWSTLFVDPYIEERHEMRMKALIDVLCNKHGVPYEKAVSAYKKSGAQFERVYKTENRTLSVAETIMYIENQTNCSLDASERWKLRTDFEEAILEIPATLVEFAKDAVALAAQNYRLGIISDTGYSPGRALRELLRREGILHYFDVLAFSDEIGVAKPCPDAFRLVEGRLNFKSSEMLHIGDTEGRDIIGARGAGWQSALFIGVRNKYFDGTSAQYVFRDWKHFTEWL